MGHSCRCPWHTSVYRTLVGLCIASAHSAPATPPPSWRGEPRLQFNPPCWECGCASPSTVDVSIPRCAVHNTAQHAAHCTAHHTATTASRLSLASRALQPPGQTVFSRPQASRGALHCPGLRVGALLQSRGILGAIRLHLAQIREPKVL